MINKRYRGTVQSALGNEWLVDLRPGQSGGGLSPRTMRLGSNGFSLSYKGSGDEFTKPLRGSEVSIIVVVVDEEVEEFVKDITQEQDQSYVIELLKEDGGIYPSYWTGYVWADTVQITYAAYPYTVSLKASDSVARFKEYKGFQYNALRVWEYFQQVFANYTPSGTVVQDGNIVLSGAGTGSNQKLRLATTYTSGASVPNENLWYEIEKSPSEVYGSGINTTANRLKVITDWLANWGCRVHLEEGYYKIMEFRDMSTGSVTWLEHDNNGTPTGVATVENITAQSGLQHVIMNDGKFYFKKAFKGSELEYVTNGGTPITTATDTRTFTLTDPRNVATKEASFGEIWNYLLYHNAGAAFITNNIGNNTTTGPATLVEIYQDNMEWLYSLPQKYFDGTITSATLKFSSLLVIGKEKYVANNLTLNAALDQWSGEWILVGEDADAAWLSKNADAQMQSKTSTNDLDFK